MSKKARSPEDQRHVPDFHVAGIGASAGGVEALEQFFSNVQPGAGIAYIVVQHLDPSADSHMVEILGRQTELPVVQAEGGMGLEADRVYTLPAGKFLAVDDESLTLSEPFKESGRRMPIDYLFRSLADSVAQRAIAVVLSGNGADGAQGVREVHAAGGLTAAQDPSTAEYDAMPHHAVQTGVVDIVLPAGEIPSAIVSYVKAGLPRARQAVREQEEPGALDQILHLLNVRQKRDFSSYKRSTVGRRVERRIAIRQVQEVAGYLEMLREDDEEARRLADEMLIGVTSFFREPEAFEALRDGPLKDLMERKCHGEDLRAWVPGCSTGEEAYSVAILLQEIRRETGKNCEIQVFATDVDEDALDAARQGRYLENAAEHIGQERLDRFFTREKGSYVVNDLLREMVVFAPHDLLGDPPFCRLDLTSCRNVLIYLQPEAQKKVLDLFAWGLSQDSLLFLGGADAVPPGDQYFDAVSSEHRIYRRNERDSPPPRNFTGRAAHRHAEQEQTPKERNAGEPAQDARLAQLNQKALLRHFDAGLLLVRRNGDILHFFGSTGKYLRHPTGKADLNIESMVPETLSTKLGLALRRASDQDEAVELHGVRLTREGQPMLVDVTVEPLSERADGGVVAVVIQECKQPPPAPPSESAEHLEVKPDLVEQLQAELEAAKREHRATTQELEATNEELRAANEEVSSMNEELRATNEELQSSKEELQSVNEELQTLNDQLSRKVGELRKVNNDLSNLLRALDVPTVIVDTELRITRVAEAAERVLSVRPCDVGRPLTDISPPSSSMVTPPPRPARC
ncbi:MAG: chemotaxis protein CheB [Planctomycetota bacterium]